MRFVLTAGLLLLALALPEAAAAGSLRCGSRLVGDGMPAIKVQAICGEPDLIDVWVPPGYGAQPVEEWTYNFGSGRLLWLLRFRGGRLEAIDSEGYGFATPDYGECGLSDIPRGMSKYRLLQRCGKPASREVEPLFYPVAPDRHWHHDRYPRYNVVPVHREIWTYNYGSSRLLRVVTLDNGRVTDVQSAGRGFDP